MKERGITITNIEGNKLNPVLANRKIMWETVTKEEIEKFIDIDKWMKNKTTITEADGEHAEWKDDNYRIVASCYDGMIYQVRGK